MENIKSRFNQLADIAKSQVQNIDIPTTKQKLTNHQGFYLVDVREYQEWEKSHIPGCIHLSKGTIESKIEKAIPDTNAEIILYCGGGSRAALAGLNLQQMGYNNVKWMDGGFRGWCEANCPIEE